MVVPVRHWRSRRDCRRVHGEKVVASIAAASESQRPRQNPPRIRDCRRVSIASSKISISPLSPTPSTPDTLRPWQFFTLGALVCATVAVFIIRGTSAENLIFVCLGIFAAALVGLAALNALRPLVTGEIREPDMIGSRTRVALEREKNLLLRSIKELEFDHAMGKVSESDYEEMVGRLRSRAVRLLQQLDSGGSGYRELIERELASRLGRAGATEVAPYTEPEQTKNRWRPHW